VTIEEFSEGVEMKMAQEICVRGNVKFENNLAYIILAPKEVLMKGHAPPLVSQIGKEEEGRGGMKAGRGREERGGRGSRE
jgi:hypothetical protein